MPSAEDTSFLIEMMPDASISQDSFTSRDVDVLVSRIKENLRLSAGFKSRSSLAQKIRATPYRLPSRSWAEPNSTGGTNTGAAAATCELCKSRGGVPGGELEHCHQHYRRYRHKTTTATAFSELEDSYERFQALLRKGSLIKEAVKRLQTSDPDEDEDDELETEEDDDADLLSNSSCNSKRRSRTSNATTYSTTLDSMDDEEDDSSNDDFLFRRKPFYYDSEDEPLPAIYQQRQNDLDL